MLVLFLFIFINTLYVGAEEGSVETRYIDLLPEKEKKEFIERIARRILQEINSKEIAKKSGEISDEHLNIHSAYVSKLLKEESENLRRRIEENNTGNSTNGNDKENKRLNVQEIEKAIDQAQKIRNGGDTKHSVIDLTSHKFNRSTDSKTTGIDSSHNIDEKNVNEKNNNQDHKNFDDKQVTTPNKQEEKENVNQELKNQDTIDPSKDDDIIDLTLRSGKNDHFTEESTISKNKNEPVSIEIEIFDKDRVENNLNDKSQIPVKVVYDMDKESKRSKINPVLIKKENNNQSATTKDGVKENKIHKQDNAQGSLKSRRALSKENLEPKIVDLAGKQNDSVDILHANETNKLETNLDQEEVLRKKRTSKDSGESNSKEKYNRTEVNLNIQNIEKEDGKHLDDEFSVTTVETKSNKYATDNETSSTTIIDKLTTPDLIKSSANNLGPKITEKKTEPPTTEKGKEPESTHLPISFIYTEPILEEQGVTHIHDNISLETTTNNGTTTEEIVKARTAFISGYPPDSGENTSVPDESNNTTASNIITENYSEVQTSASEKANNITPKEIIRTRTEFIKWNTSDREKNLLAPDKSNNTTLISENANNNTISVLKETSTRGSIKNIKTLTNQSEAATANAELRDSVVIYVTNISPLTTLPPYEQVRSAVTTDKLKTIRAMGDEVVIRNDSIVIKVENKGHDAKSASTTEDLSKPILRQDLKDDSSGRYDEAEGDKFRSPLKKYVVYEMLPGQQPFVPQKSAAKRNPRNYPKLPTKEKLKYIGEKLNYKYSEDETTQIEPPSYAPIYNYEPKYAYYNPNNKYGPNLNDNVNILQTTDSKHSDYSGQIYLDSHSSYEFPELRYKKPKNKEPIKDDKKDIGLDYYFGLARKQLLSKENGNQNDEECIDDGTGTLSKNCETNERVVVQDPLVPPNSNSAEHAYNSALHKNPPRTHLDQVRTILSGLSHYMQIHTTKPNNITTIRPSGWTTAYTYPPFDLLKKLRQGPSKSILRTNESELYTKQKKIKEQLSNHLRLKVFNSRNQFVDEESIENSRYHYKVPQKLRINNKILKKSTKLRKRPLILLTGNINQEFINPRTQIKIGKFKPIDLGYYDSDPDPLYQNRPQKNKKLRDLYYVFGGKKIEKDIASDNYENNDSEDVEKAMKLNKEAMQFVLNLTDYKQLPALYPDLKLRTTLMNDTLPFQSFMNIRSETNVEPYLNVIEDMIYTDNKALTNYDWLGTTVDIRSAVAKLIDLSATSRKEDGEIRPEDLQLLKYTLYLFSSAKPSTVVDIGLKTQKEADEERSKGEVPRNMRFLQSEPLVASIKSVRHSKSFDLIRERPWLVKDGINAKLLEFEEFWNDFHTAIDELHDAIKHIALITKYRAQHWYKNLKELYLENPTRKKLLQILLHLSATRLFGLIEESSINGMKKNYVTYAMRHPEEVLKATEEFAFLVDVLDELDKL